MDQIIEINIGPLSSVNSLHKYIGRELEKLRDLYRNGSSPHIIWNATQLRYGQVSMAGLTSLLSIGNNLSSFIGSPQKIIFDWKPDLIGFLVDISFIEISIKFSIFEFENDIFKEVVKNRTNPNTKIIYYADILRINLGNDELPKYKDELKSKIRPNLNLRCSEIFSNLDINLESVVSKTCVELIVNSLIHGKSIVFVGLQRTYKRITVAICDSGIGFPLSLRNNYEILQDRPLLSHVQGLLLGCIIQTHEHGLKLAINEILNIGSVKFKDILENDGWVTISSYDTEIRWQKTNWVNTLNKINYNDILESVEDPVDILGEPVEYKIEVEDRLTGYWQKFFNPIRGTRIVFEIPIKN